VPYIPKGKRDAYAGCPLRFGRALGKELLRM